MSDVTHNFRTDRARRGGILPASKEEFPKCLYLDQNKWIDLARAQYGKDGGERFADALEAVREAVSRKTLIAPISIVHIMETLARRDPSSRLRLARFIVDVSRNLSMLPSVTIRPWEIRAAVEKRLDVNPVRSVRPQIIRRGAYGALGVDLQVDGPPGAVTETVEEFLHSPEASVQALMYCRSEDEVRESRAEYDEMVREVEEIRRRSAGLSPDLRHRIELAELFTKGEPAKELLQALRDLGVNSKALTARLKGPEEYTEFFHGIPTVDIFVTLGLHRDRNLDRDVDPNDLKDLGFLSVAVPYSNIVATEKFWVHLLTATGLSDKYDTTVVSDVAPLRTILESQGCL